MSGNDASARRPPLNVGLVGLGYWGPNLLRVLLDMEDINVSRICDLDSRRLGRFARRYPSARPTTRFEELVEDDALDAIVIATPVYTHFELASCSIAAGKHTFVEKPLAPSSEQVQALVDLASEQRVVLMAGQTFVYSPPVRAVEELIRAGELGEIYFVASSRVNLGLHQRDVSVIWDLGPHDFSILLFWFKEMPESVGTVGRDSVVRGITDVAFVNLAFPSGIVANLELSWLAPSKLRRTVIVGSDKMIVYEDGSPEPIRIFNHGVVYNDPETFGEYQLSYRTGDIVSPRLDTSEPIAIELSEFAAAIREGEPPPGHLELAKNIVTLAEAAETSLLEGGARVSLTALA